MDNILNAKEIEDFDRPIFDRANVLIVRADSTMGGLVRGVDTVQIVAGAPKRFNLLRETAASSGIVPREGLAKSECERFERGGSNALFEPLCMKIIPKRTTQLSYRVENVDEDQTMPEADVICADYALATPEFDVSKVEVGILMRQAADRSHGITARQRGQIHAYVERRVVGDLNWSTTTVRPRGPDDPEATATGTAATALCRALLSKAHDIVKIQADQGKVWRSSETVKNIRKSALTVAAAYNSFLLTNDLIGDTDGNE